MVHMHGSPSANKLGWGVQDGIGRKGAEFVGDDRYDLDDGDDGIRALPNDQISQSPRQIHRNPFFAKIYVVNLHLS